MTNYSSSQRPLSYSYQFLMDMNDPQLTALLPSEIGDFLTAIPQGEITSDTRETYKNNYNIFFHPNRKTTGFQSSDPKIIKNIRSMLATINHDNWDQKIAPVSELLEHIQLESEWLEAGKLFYGNMIDNPLLMDAFIQLLLALEQRYPRLVGALHIQIYQQSINPQQFTDSLTETGPDRTKRWMIANGLLICLIHQSHRVVPPKLDGLISPGPLYSKEFMLQAIQRWLVEVQPKQTLGLEVLVKVLPKLKNVELPLTMKQQIQQISQDRQYPMRLRMLLDLPLVQS